MKKIAIEFDTEDQASYIPQVQNMVSKLGFASEIVSSEQINNGELLNFDAVIFPGGLGAFYGLRTYSDFREAIRYFVAGGGGYMGVCGGAYVAGLRMSATLQSFCPDSLGLLDANIVSPPWIKYIAAYREAAEKRVAVTCQISEESHPITTPYEGLRVEIVYSGGPLIKDVGPSVIRLLTYLDGLMPSGDTALCCSVFGKGRVVISSPHPETPWGPELIDGGCQEWLYLNMLRWVSEPEEKTYFPFLPWETKKLLAYPAIPTLAALSIGVVGTVSVTELIKRRRKH